MKEDITQIQIDILNELRQRSRRHTAIKSLGKKFQIALPKVNSAISELENWGYIFSRNDRGDIKYSLSPDTMFPHEIAHGLRTKYIGQNIFSFDRVGSTNDLASRHAENGALQGTIVIAERQTAGRGRLGRTWHSPRKTGIYFSIILRPEITPAKAPGLSLIAALAVAETIGDSLKTVAKIKWPNDVLIDGSKVAGILTELSAEVDRVKFVIVGIGVNVNQDQADFPDELKQKATSLKIATGSEVSRVWFLQKLLASFETKYESFLRHGLSAQRKSLKKHSAILSRKIKFHLNGKTMTGTALDIDDNGMLVVESGGETLTLNSGEVSLEETY